MGLTRSRTTQFFYSLVVVLLLCNSSSEQICFNLWLTGRTQFAIGSRKSKIENDRVPVVQRIERGFPKAKTAFLQEFASVISDAQTAVFKRLD